MRRHQHGESIEISWDSNQLIFIISIRSPPVMVNSCFVYFVRYFETRLINWDNMNSCLRARRYPEAMWKQTNSFSASRIVSSNRVRGIDNHPHVDRRGNGEQAWEEAYHFSFVDLLRCINIISPEIFAREIGTAGCKVIHWCMLDVWSLGSLDGP